MTDCGTDVRTLAGLVAASLRPGDDRGQTVASMRLHDYVTDLAGGRDARVLLPMLLGAARQRMRETAAAGGDVLAAATVAVGMDCLRFAFRDTPLPRGAAITLLAAARSL